MNPTTIQNVVTYDTVIEFANPDQKIFPGMTAYVTIPVATAENVVKVPNAALRYKPPLAPDVVKGLLAKLGIAEKPSARGEGGIVWKLGADGALAPAHYQLCSRPVNTEAHMSNLLLLMAQRMGVDADKFGDSNKVIEL